MQEDRLRTKYDDAFERHQAAEEAREAAEKEKEEKSTLVDKMQNGTKERHLAEARVCKSTISWIERKQREHIATVEMYQCYTGLMECTHGADGEEAQIVKFQSELTRANEFFAAKIMGRASEWLYGGNQSKLVYLSEWVCHQLEAECYSEIVNKFSGVLFKFLDRVKNESNLEAFHEAWSAAGAALDKWKNGDDRNDWDKFKPNYDVELVKWNGFEPKYKEYIKELESEVDECIKGCPGILYLRFQQAQRELHERDQRICELENEIGQSDQVISELQAEVHQLKMRIGKVCKWSESLSQANRLLLGIDFQHWTESESSPHSASEDEWQDCIEETPAGFYDSAIKP